MNGRPAPRVPTTNSVTTESKAKPVRTAMEHASDEWSGFINYGFEARPLGQACLRRIVEIASKLKCQASGMHLDWEASFNLASFSSTNLRFVQMKNGSPIGRPIFQPAFAELASLPPALTERRLSMR